MTTHDIDIELPPLPAGYAPEVAAAMRNYARAAIEPYAKRIAELESARMAYASEFPINEDGEPDVGRIHENIRKLKADHMRKGEPVAWHSKLYGTVWMAIKPGRLVPGTQWFIDGRTDPVAEVISPDSLVWRIPTGDLPHGTVFYSTPQPAEPVKTLIDNQEPLGEEFQRVLDEHSWDLYVKTNEPVKCIGCEGKPAPENSPCAVCGNPAEPVAIETLQLLKDARHRIANLSRAEVPFRDPLDGPVLRRLDAAIAKHQQQAGEPVAWKWRRTPATKWECVGHWDSIEAKAAAEMESQGWEVVRLYDSPQPPEPRK